MIKRTFDFLLASFGIIFFLPLALLFALLIKIEDGGPIFYKQERWGKGGKKFIAYKFRTMVSDAHCKGGNKLEGESGGCITCIGKFLRATAMDELPQLFNIWKGDMSFVGPRALSTAELDPSFPHFKERHEIRPALTGPAQVYASRYAPLEEKFRYDLEYIRSHSFLKDITLLFLSLWITLRKRWESQERKI